MTTLTWTAGRRIPLGIDDAGSGPLSDYIDSFAREIRPSTDAFLESAESALSAIFRSTSEQVEPKPIAFFFAKTFLNAIGDGPKVSRISMDQDGEPILEWKSSPARKLTLCFGENGDISFAGRMAENYLFGNEKFDGTPSEAIVSLIRQVSRSA